AGCSGTNELAKYNLNGTAVMFTERVSRNASEIQITTEDPANKKEDNTVLGILASVGSDILSDDSKAKLKSAVDTRILAGYVSEGLRNAMETYLSITPVDEVSDNPAYIVETVLEECKLVVKETGVSVYVQANGRIIDRASGNLVWENWEGQTIPIDQNTTDGKSSKTVVKVFNALQLSSLDKDELNRVVGAAADDVGAYMAETFREDLVESRTSK